HPVSAGGGRVELAAGHRLTGRMQATAAGSTHHAASPAAAATAVPPSAITTARATRQSSPTTKSYPNRRTPRTLPIARPHVGGGRRDAAQQRDLSEPEHRDGRH